MLKIYFAGPISGESGDRVFAYYDQVKERFKGRAVVLTPMIGKGQLRFEQNYAPQGYTCPTATDHAIAERDKWMTSKMADVVFANLMDTSRVSIGTIAELAWASGAGVHTIVAMAAGDVHEHAFVVEMADIRYWTEEDALVYLEELCDAFIERPEEQDLDTLDGVLEMPQWLPCIKRYEELDE